MKLEISQFEELRTLFNQGVSLDDIRLSLIEKGYHTEAIEDALRYLKELKYKKQRQIGFNCIAIGAVLCLSSCFLTMIHDYSAIYSAFVLYGLTTAGAGLVLVGLALIFGI